MTVQRYSKTKAIQSVCIKGALALCLALGIMAPASAKTYDCVFTTGVSSVSWITGNYIIQHDEDAGTATVIDGLINALEGKPIAVEEIEATDGKVVFEWEVRTRDSSGQDARMRYRAAWFKGPQFMRISASPLGYSNMFESQGSCTLN